MSHLPESIIFQWTILSGPYSRNRSYMLALDENNESAHLRPVCRDSENAAMCLVPSPSDFNLSNDLFYFPEGASSFMREPGRSRSPAASARRRHHGQFSQSSNILDHFVHLATISIWRVNIINFIINIAGLIWFAVQIHCVGTMATELLIKRTEMAA